MISQLRGTNAMNRDQHYQEVFEPIHEKKKRQHVEISGYVHSRPHNVHSRAVSAHQIATLLRLLSQFVGDLPL